MTSFSVREIAEIIQGRLVNEKEVEGRLDLIQVERPAALAGSGGRDLAFFFSRAYEQELVTAAPGILVTGEAFVGPLTAAQLPFWRSTAVLACRDPYLAMGILSEKFAPLLSTVAHLPASSSEQAILKKPEVHPSAVVAASAQLGDGVKIGPNCVIEDGAQIGAGTVLYSGCYVGPGCSVGRDCVLFPGVVLYEWTQLGDRVRIHANSVLGADGFGYAPRKSGGVPEGHQKIYHLGRVVVGDDVEMGALTTVDRGTLGDTQIRSQAKLDDQVHIGHNCSVGEGAVICGATGLAGGAIIGKFAYIGGLAGISNQVQVGDGAKVGAMSLVTKDVPARGTVVGNPQREYREHFRVHALLNKLLEERRSK